MPFVVGQPASQAQTTLKNEGLAVVIKDQNAVAPTVNNTVLSQAPKKNTLVKKGDTVTLTVAKITAVQMETVPSLAGQTQSQAQNTLKQSHLVLGTSPTQATSTTYQAGFVISSVPPPGTQLPRNSAVNLVVSIGPPPTTTTTTSPPTTTTPPRRRRRPRRRRQRHPRQRRQRQRHPRPRRRRRLAHSERRRSLGWVSDRVSARSRPGSWRAASGPTG